MPITPGEGEFWKEYSGQLKKSMDFISDHGLSVLGREEIKRIAYPIIREAKKRVRELEREGLTDSPAYRYLIRNEVNLTASGKNLNSIRHNLREAWTFLQQKTSTIEGSRDFFTSTVERWVGDFTNKEQREKIWDTYHRLEKIHPGYFSRETYGSDELSADIYTIAQTLDGTDWDIDAAISRFDAMAEIDDATELESEAISRWSGWL